MKIKTVWPGGMVEVPDCFPGEVVPLGVKTDKVVVPVAKKEGLAATILGLARNYKGRIA